MKNRKKSYKYLERGENMKYSLLFGEMTDGYEWTDASTNAHACEKARCEEKTKISVIFSMIFLLFAMCLSKVIVSYEGVSQSENGYYVYVSSGDSVYASASDENTVNELDFSNAMLENEHKARISELVNTYIEENRQMLEKGKN